LSPSNYWQIDASGSLNDQRRQGLHQIIHRFHLRQKWFEQIQRQGATQPAVEDYVR
jgi:hypothetical protein